MHGGQRARMLRLLAATRTPFVAALAFRLRRLGGFRLDRSGLNLRSLSGLATLGAAAALALADRLCRLRACRACCRLGCAERARFGNSRCVTGSPVAFLLAAPGALAALAACRRRPVVQRHRAAFGVCHVFDPVAAQDPDGVCCWRAVHEFRWRDDTSRGGFRQFVFALPSPQRRPKADDGPEFTGKNLEDGATAPDAGDAQRSAVVRTWASEMSFSRSRTPFCSE